MHQQAMDVAVANRAQATPAPLRRAEMNLAGIPGLRRARLFNAAGWAEVSSRCNTGWAQ
jgi:hypothetical protein